MHRRKKQPLTNLRPDLSLDELATLPRDHVGYARLKKLEERILEVRRELDAKLDVINRVKPQFENWMDHELAFAKRAQTSCRDAGLPDAHPDAKAL